MIFEKNMRFGIVVYRTLKRIFRTSWKLLFPFFHEFWKFFLIKKIFLDFWKIIRNKKQIIKKFQGKNSFLKFFFKICDIVIFEGFLFWKPLKINPRFWFRGFWNRQTLFVVFKVFPFLLFFHSNFCYLNNTKLK